MFYPFYQHSYFYLIIVALQIICAVHSIRKGTMRQWFYVIIFIPVIGSFIYLFSEVFTRRTRSNIQDGIFSILVSNNTRIRRLEEQLKFTDTFNNRILLADAYLAAGHTDNAIELYESSLTGAFDENEHVIRQLMIAYYIKKDYERIQPLAKKIYNKPQFARSRAHIFYAISLEKIGRPDLAEQEFKKMKGRFGHFEARLQYGLFLKRAGRDQEARQTFLDMIDEAPHLSSRERRDSRAWIAQAREELHVRQSGSTKM